MKNEKSEIDGTVLWNEHDMVAVVAADGRIYRHQYHKNSNVAELIPGTIVRVYYHEVEHNDIRVTGVLRFEDVNEES